MTALKPASAAQASTGARIQRIVSPKGVEAWLIEEQAVPLVAMEISFEGGSAQDPAGKSGLANFLSGMFDEGAGPLDAIAFQEALDEHAIHCASRPTVTVSRAASRRWCGTRTRLSTSCASR